MFKYSIFSLILLALLGSNLLFWHNRFWGVFLFIIYILYYGRRLGILAFPKFNQFWHRLLGPLLLLAGLSVIGTLTYYFYALTNNIILLLLILFPLSLIPYCQIKKRDIADWVSGQLEPVPLVEPKTKAINFWSWVVIFGDLYLFYYLFIHATTEAIRSPWLVISYKFFIAYFIVSLILIAYARRAESSLRSSFVIFLHVLLMLSISLIIYKLGYGFDPYLHRASEEYIAKFGALLPKTPYYLGQYVLVVLISKITGLSVALIDKTILILFEAFFLPPLIFLALRHGLDWERSKARLGSILLFALPFTHMIATTPQALSNFFALTALFFGIIYLATDLIKWWVVPSLILATLFVHPLTGLPMVIFCLLMLLLKWRSCETKKPLSQIAIEALIFIFFLISLFIIPYLFIVFLKADFHPPSLSQVLANLPHWPISRTGLKPSIFLTVIYYLKYFLAPLFLILSGWGIWSISKNKNQRSSIALLIFSFLIFILNAFALKFILTFANIGEAEQGQYAERLYYFSFYLLVPLALAGLFLISNSIKRTSMRWIASLVFAGLLTLSLYFSYPRVDAYSLSHYINTSASDLKAVHQIEEKSGREPYLVLANISFSAGAIQEFGFRNYYKTPQGEIFYYSLPTGAPLYHYFEKMSYISADKATMREAMDLTNVKQAYFVLNSYWDSFKRALPEAQASADEWWAVDEKVFIFRYKR